MTDKLDDKYYSLCPDGRHSSFESEARQIADLTSGIDGEMQSIRPPSKVKSELKNLSKTLCKLSLEAQSSLWEMADDGSSYSPSSDMLLRIEMALARIPEGRPKKDEVRYYLGVNAVNLWWSHSGDIEANDFVDFLEYLIEEAGFEAKDGGKARIDSVALADQMRKKFEDCGPPRFEKSKFFTT